MRSPLHSFAAVFFGFVVMTIAALVVKLVFQRAMGPPTAHPTAVYLACNLVATCLPIAIAGLVTAFLAPSRPLQHTYAVAGVFFVLGVLSYLRFATAQPFWYQIVMQVLPPMCALGGGFLVASVPRRPNR